MKYLDKINAKITLIKKKMSLCNYLTQLPLQEKLFLTRLYLTFLTVLNSAKCGTQFVFPLEDATSLTDCRQFPVTPGRSTFFRCFCKPLLFLGVSKPPIFPGISKHLGIVGSINV